MNLLTIILSVGIWATACIEALPYVPLQCNTGSSYLRKPCFRSSEIGKFTCNLISRCCWDAEYNECIQRAARLISEATKEQTQNSPHLKEKINGLQIVSVSAPGTITSVPVSTVDTTASTEAAHTIAETTVNEGTGSITVNVLVDNMTQSNRETHNVGKSEKSTKIGEENHRTSVTANERRESNTKVSHNFKPYYGEVTAIKNTEGESKSVEKITADDNDPKVPSEAKALDKSDNKIAQPLTDAEEQKNDKITKRRKTKEERKAERRRARAEKLHKRAEKRKEKELRRLNKHEAEGIKGNSESLEDETTETVLHPLSTNSRNFEEQVESSAILTSQNRVLEWAVPTILQWEDAWNENVEGSSDVYIDNLKKNIF